jgi:hypothetical protein
MSNDVNVPRRNRKRLRASSWRLALALSAVTGGFVQLQGAAGLAAAPLRSSSTGSLAQLDSPKPLRGVALVRPTGVQLLVANYPPFLLDVDTGRIKSITGLQGGRGHAVLSVRAVGKDAVIWLDRPTYADKIPRAQIFVVRHGATKAIPIATGWDVAPASSGRAIWIKSYKDTRHCTLREVGLDGRQERNPRPLLCSTLLFDAGGGPLLSQRGSVVNALTGRKLLGTGVVWAMIGHQALSRAASRHSLTLTDLRTGKRWRLPWPSRIESADQAAVPRNGSLVALGFSDPAYQGGGTQVTDVWLLDPATRRFQHLPDMPAEVALKFTSMSWTSDGRLVMLAETAGQDVIAVWRPGQKRIAFKTMQLPARNSGSDSFVVWKTLAKTSTPFDWRKLHRALHVPQPATGAPCPVGPGKPAPGYGRTTGQTFNGRGPAYLIGNGNVPAGVIDISQLAPDSRGWLGQKTPWAVSSRYRGPVLIRGVRIDQPGDVRFATGYGQHLRELRWPSGVDVGRGGAFRSFASSTLFRSAGCYAFQADGASFSTVVVMRVNRRSTANRVCWRALARLRERCSHRRSSLFDWAPRAASDTESRGAQP